jgi:hypothetical protein
MAAFVLVHGGWHGGWCWCEVEALLAAQGHRVFAPTLTGLGERCHLIDAFVPTKDGQGAADLSIASRTAEIAKAGEGHDHNPPYGFEHWSSDPNTIDWLKRRTTPQPRGCFGKGVTKAFFIYIESQHK